MVMLLVVAMVVPIHKPMPLYVPMPRFDTEIVPDAIQ